MAMKPELRSVRRFPLELPISVKFAGSQTPDGQCHTRDVSSRGAFFYSDSTMAKDSAVEFVLTLPKEITLAAPLHVRCHGKVVRIDKSAQQCGVAVAIEKYDFLSEE